jgi:hypothetical protein
VVAFGLGYRQTAKVRICGLPKRDRNVLHITISIRKTPRCLASPQILGSRHLQPLRAAHPPPLHLTNMTRAAGALLGLGQGKGDKEGGPFGGARRMNATA